MDLVTILLLIVGVALGFFAGRITAPTTGTNSGKEPVSRYRENKNTDIK